MTRLDDVLRRNHLPALDGLRAVAVAVVMVYHAGVPFGLELIPGDLGVTAFFVLSGFLITWLLLKERSKTGQISLRKFYLRRSLRIFPAYYVFVAVSMALDQMLGDPWSGLGIVTSLTYTVNYRNALLGNIPPVAHAWSLAVEEQFYLIWPVLLIFLASTGQLRRGLVAIIAGVCVWRSVLYLGVGVPGHYVYNAFDTRFDSLAIGCLLAVIVQTPNFLRIAARIARRAWYPLPVLAAIYVSRDLIGPAWHNSVGFTVDSLLVAVVIVQLLQLSSTSFWRWLDSRFAVWMGALSYPLYLWHGWGLGLADNVTGSTALLPNILIGTVFSFLLASLSYYGVEKYFLSLKDRLFGRSSGAGDQVGMRILSPALPRVGAFADSRERKEDAKSTGET